VKVASLLVCGSTAMLWACAPPPAVSTLSRDDSAAPPADAPRGQHARELRTEIVRPISARYLLHLPAGYGDPPPEGWPLILYLHGGSRRGLEVDSVRAMGLPRVVEENPSFPFVVVSPQTEPGTLWTDTDRLIALLDDVVARHAVDPRRVYLTGHSMGGNGAWYLAYQHPERFAAVAPMSGPANPWWATRLREVPVWAFHGADDEVVPVRESEEMVRALRAAGNTRVRLSVLPGREHGVLDLYEDAEGELYRWFLQHRRP
jgi:poly(3-hydroxybutyrate) depolymerase